MALGEPPRRTREDFPKETWKRRGGTLWVQCTSDGSGDFPREDRLRRCGYSLYFAPDHPWNVEEPLNGQNQTAPRAELRAILALLPRVCQPTLVLCDCLGVVNGVQQLLDGRRLSPPRDHQGLCGRVWSSP